MTDTTQAANQAVRRAETGAAATRTASAYVISITPFTPDGLLDEASLRAHLARLKAAGIGVYAGGGGSGEGYTLTRDEVRRVLEIASEELADAGGAYAMGVEPRTAEEMIAFLKGAKAAGVAAAQVYCLDVGHGHSPTSEELRGYFLEVASASDLPLVISTHQSVGYKVGVELIAELSETCPNIVGVNCSHHDLSYLAGVIDAAGPRLQVHVGGPHAALTAMALGADGFLSSEANLAPRLCMQVIERRRTGHLAGMLSAHGKLMRLSTALYGAGGIRATKAVLNRLGLPGGFPRKPRLPIPAATVDALMDVVAGLELHESEGWSDSTRA